MKNLNCKILAIVIVLCLCVNYAKASSTELEDYSYIDLSSSIIKTANGLYWGTNSISYYCDEFSTNEIAAISNAFSTWSNVSYTTTSGYTTYSVSFSFTRVFSASNADIVIEKGILPSGAVAISDIRDYYGRSSLNGTAVGEIEEATIILSSSLNYSIGPVNNKYDIQSVVVHEIGHVLGIAHCHEDGGSCSYTCSSNVMNPTIPAGATRRTWQEFDKASLIVIYIFNHPF